MWENLCHWLVRVKRVCFFRVWNKNWQSPRWTMIEWLLLSRWERFNYFKSSLKINSTHTSWWFTFFRLLLRKNVLKNPLTFEMNVRYEKKRDLQLIFTLWYSEMIINFYFKLNSSKSHRKLAHVECPLTHVYKSSIYFYSDSRLKVSKWGEK